MVAVTDQRQLPGISANSAWWLTATALLSAGCGFLCYFIAGNSLDLFIGGLFFAVLLVCPLSAIAGRLPGSWIVVMGVSSGITVSWWMPVHHGFISARQWFECVAVLFSFVAMMAILVAVLMRMGLSPMASMATTTMTALLWLTWPIWLSGSLSGSSLRGSVMFQPIFAINHAVSNLGIWTEQQVAYNLTNLGQDTQYRLPGSVWPAVGLQAAIAVVLILSMRRENTAGRD